MKWSEESLQTYGTQWKKKKENKKIHIMGIPEEDKEKNDRKHI